jgi:hypothetical protein
MPGRYLLSELIGLLLYPVGCLVASAFGGSDGLIHISLMMITIEWVADGSAKLAL